MGRGGKSRGKSIHGWLAIHKSRGMTSSQVVERVRHITRAAKAGHGGTLDPFSEGLLPVALGEATKTLVHVLEGDKGYRCWVRFGAETDTCDPTGSVVREGGEIPGAAAITAALERFRGEIDQVPPIYSAIHVDGERAYERARRGEVFEMEPRKIVIHDIGLESMEGPVAHILVRSGKGAYMRALARDLGRYLGCPAHLERLLRTRTLGFSLEEGVTLDQLDGMVRDDRLQEVLFPMDRVLDDIPALRLRVDVWHKVKNGQAVWLDAEGFASGAVRLLDPDGRFAALGDLEGGGSDSPRRLCKLKRLFHFA
ncbi:MAG: tRNA pseudouridine(55) synthase TruB [Magnetococcales bacterium]|nr:tRNA pseudouridine(55) synthase TruB [Magnetococcales bacterium]MBF0418732.1 tRNA pseudouridine(55) synthase TruB [Magnetococcales bacterium]